MQDTLQHVQYAVSSEYKVTEMGELFFISPLHTSKF